MGTIAARDCLRVLELTEQVAAGLLVTVRQAISLRLQTGEIQSGQLGSDLAAFCAALEADIPFIDEDQPLEATLRQLLVRIQSRHWTLYDDEEA